MKLLFMGTPDIAAACLTAILQDGTHSVCGVYTREDKPSGRKQILTPPPVKEVALAHQIPVFQPKTLRDGQAAKEIAALCPDLMVVVAYGRILTQEVLDIPRYGAINVHVSLLPQYRGAAPIQRAVLAGDAMTGVTVMQLDAGIDTGDILSVTPVTIGKDETSGEVFERMTKVGADALLEALAHIADGTATRTPQDHAKATLAPMLTKEEAQFTFDAPAQHLHNLIRGMNPWPVAYFIWENKKIKVLRSSLQKDVVGKASGEILALKPLTVACAQGAIVLDTVVPEGSRPMTGSAWAAGKRFSVGDMLPDTKA
ncbi:MAG: methionyl-tRNA formyltransferase [Ruthenibacterium sp.]